MEGGKGYIHMEINDEGSSFVSEGLSDDTIFVLCAMHMIYLSHSLNIPMEQVHQMIDTFDESCVIVKEDIE
ncbi:MULTISPECIES: hypothetical protein [Enterococcus]|uniref:Uncharacterized protein n=1 Tax=Enterococcus gallinarum TaxID=1353 RepID=A0A376H1F5_ENTGA|nr:hypothetical protein [Enterococcus gallinarum]EGO8423963.1 hypothetical protein [Enterococcus faecalis]OJG48977.1 hypothetical protein RV03_GL000435 [Enterococcus gallinarum]STD72725.1 Uncharacterised protein [Enterococcus gallinarum]STD82645.1 Uncharacterised protein [Enterococcus gallinarum]